jgi:hypothetical protein
MSRVAKGIIGTLTVLVLFAVGYFVRGQLDTHHFLYICPGTHRDSNCVNGQEFEIFDANGAPIYSVGEAGGDAVFGDNRSVFPPDSVFHPSIVESYTTPSGYGSKGCVAPALWISPAAFFSCEGGAWVQTLTP